MLNTRRPIRVAVLCSNRAPGLLYLLNRTPDRGFTFDIVCCVTSGHAFSEQPRVESRGIPTIAHPIREFYQARSAPLYRDMAVRAEYDAETLRLLEPYFPDVLLLDGYLFLITAPLLTAFPSRVINLHYADLALRRPDGGPRFPGIRAVRDALAAGCHETRATVHLVDAEPDDGPPMVRSWTFPVSPLVRDVATMSANDVFKAYVYAHQQWMIRTVSGPLIAAALRLIATGAVNLDALAASRDTNAAWLLDRNGSMHEPEPEPALRGAGVA